MPIKGNETQRPVLGLHHALHRRRLAVTAPWPHPARDETITRIRRPRPGPPVLLASCQRCGLFFSLPTIVSAAPSAPDPRRPTLRCAAQRRATADCGMQCARKEGSAQSEAPYHFALHSVSRTGLQSRCLHPGGGTVLCVLLSVRGRRGDGPVCLPLFETFIFLCANRHATQGAVIYYTHVQLRRQN